MKDWGFLYFYKTMRVMLRAKNKLENTKHHFSKVCQESNFWYIKNIWPLKKKLRN